MSYSYESIVGHKLHSLPLFTNEPAYYCVVMVARRHTVIRYVVSEEEIEDRRGIVGE